MLSSIVSRYLRKWVVDADVTKVTSNLMSKKEIRFDKVKDFVFTRRRDRFFFR